MKEKISVKTLYLLGIIAIGLIGLGVGSTYAMFTASAEINNPISISANLNSEDDIIETIDLELEPNDIRVAVINLNNTSNATLNYASFYITESSDIEVGVTHNFTDTAVPTGSISNGTTKKIYIQVKNSGSNTANVTLGILSNSGNIVKAENMTLINDTNIDTASPEILITGQDMVVQNGLIRYYNGSNNLEYSHSTNTAVWKDLSGNYDGEVNNLTWNTSSAVFNGTNSHVRIGQINNLTAVTVETFLKANSYSTTDANQIISNYNGNGLVLQLNKGVPGFSIGSGKTIASDEAIDLGVHHTITGTYDGSTVKLYVDGVLKKTLSSTAGISNPTDTTPMVIGCNPNTTGCDTHYTAADIYAVRIYNRALTQTEIKQNMNADRISVGGQQNTTAGDFTILSNKRLNGFTEDNVSFPSRFKINNFTKVNDKHYILSIEDRELTAYSFDISIPANNAIDVSGNKNSNAITYTYEHKGSGSNLVGSTITKNTSTSRTVTYTITFNDNVYGFTADDITVSEGTKGTFTKVNQKKYTLVVTHTSDGSKTITVKASGCNDSFGNLNSAKSLTHTIDTVKPTVTITKNTSTSKTVTYTFTFSEAVTGFTASSVTLSEGTKGTFTKVSDSKYTLVVTHSTYGSKTITVAAGACKDSAGNGNTAKSLTHTIIGTPFATYITNLYKNGTKSTVTVNSITYNRVTAQLLMNDRKGSSSTGADAGNIRYYGADPNNYVYFNCSNYSNQSSSTCEVWRIIGVFDGKVKIMRKDAIGSYPWEKYWSGGSGTAPHNDWTKAKLMRLLNTGYESETVNNSLYWNHKSGTCYKSRTVTNNGTTTTYDTSDCDFTSIGIKDGSTKNMIVSNTYGMKGWNSFGVYPDKMYNYELSTGKIPSSYATTWTGKVALPSVSDYGYAIDIGQCSSVISANVSTTCKNSNWLNFSGSYWFLNQHYNSDNDQVCYYRPSSSSTTLSYTSSHQEYSVHPVVFLSSSVNVDPSTKGTSSNPYKLLP